MELVPHVQKEIDMNNRTLAVQARDSHGTSYLLGSQYPNVRKTRVLSPFFQLKRCPQTIENLNGRTGHEMSWSRDTRISEIMKAILVSYTFAAGPSLAANTAFFNGSTFVDNVIIGIPGVDFDTDDLPAATVAAIVAYAVTQSYAVTAADVEGLLPTNQMGRSFSNPSLAVNTARQASTTRDALVIASVEIDANLSLSGGAKGTVSLQYADNNTFTTNLKTASVGVNGNTGTLTIGLNTTQAGGGSVVGLIPAGKYYRLFTTNTTGTPTFGTPVIQEILL